MAIARVGEGPNAFARFRRRVMQLLDGFLFVFAGISAVWLAWLLLTEGVRFGWQVLLLLGFWLVFTYLLLPRIHRILTRLYVPDYFIGRTRTGDGLLGDPVNLALLGHEAQVHQTMTAAGWTRADDLTWSSGRRMISSTLGRRSYPQAPVSALLLFDRQHDFAYQQEVAGSPSKRHHVRFWRAPAGWLLPGGFRVDWIAAGTYDRSVGFSLFTLQITHKIEMDTDIERDFILSTVQAANPEVSVRVIENFATGYHSRNGGGDRIETDGDLPVVDLTAVPAVPLPVVELSDSRDKRPAQTFFAALVSFGTAAFRLLYAAVILLASPTDLGLDTEGLTASDITVLRWIVAVTFVVFAAADVIFGMATLAGRNWARVLLMISAVLSIASNFATSLTPEGFRLTGDPTVGFSILVLLALTSHSAREWALRPRTKPKRIRDPRHRSGSPPLPAGPRRSRSALPRRSVDRDPRTAGSPATDPADRSRATAGP